MAEYTTSVDICNKALQEIGVARITALNDNSPQAAECNFLYDKSRVAVLREHVWNCSISYATITSAAGVRTYMNGTTRPYYSLPAGFIRFADQNPRNPGLLTQSTTGGIKSTDIAIEQLFLVTAFPVPFSIRYQGDITLVTSMDPLLCDTIAARMNMDGLAEILTGSATKRQLAERRYEERIALAKLINLIEAAGDEPNAVELQTARVLEKQVAPPAPQQRGNG